MAGKLEKAGKHLVSWSGIGLIVAFGTTAQILRNNEHSKKDTHKTAADVTLLSAERVSKLGGVLVDAGMSRGVDCSPSSKIKILQGPNKGKYFLDSSDSMVVDPNFDAVAQANRGSKTRAVFAGLDSTTAYNLGGYYPLISGWAVRHTANTENYRLYHFDGIQPGITESVPIGTEKNGKTEVDNISLGSIVGRQVVKFTSLDLDFGRSFTYQDGHTSVTVQAPAVSSFPAELQVDISCAPSLPLVSKTP